MKIHLIHNKCWVFSFISIVRKVSEKNYDFSDRSRSIKLRCVILCYGAFCVTCYLMHKCEKCHFRAVPKRKDLRVWVGKMFRQMSSPENSRSRRRKSAHFSLRWPSVSIDAVRPQQFPPSAAVFLRERVGGASRTRTTGMSQVSFPTAFPTQKKNYQDTTSFKPER